MLKKITKFFVIILLAMLVLTPTVMATDVQKQKQSKINVERYPTSFSTKNSTSTASATTLSVGQTVTIGSYSAGFFCMNRGLIFNRGTLFRVYEAGSVAGLNLNHGVNHDNGLLLSFIIGDMQRAAIDDSTINGSHLDNRHNQPWAEYIWYLLDWTTSSAPSGYQHLVEKYAEYKEIYDAVMNHSTTPAITITPPNPDIVIADENGMIGPFTVTYPYSLSTNAEVAKINELVDIKIIVNDSNILYNNDSTTPTNKLQRADGTPFQIGDTEFYLAVTEVNYGEHNKFKVDLNFTYYNIGTYAKLTPIREMFIEYECDECGAIQRFYLKGYLETNGTGGKILPGISSFNPMGKNETHNSIGSDSWTSHSAYTIKGFEDGTAYSGDEEHYMFGYHPTTYDYVHQHKGGTADNPYPIYSTSIVSPTIRFLELAENGTNPDMYNAGNYGLQDFLYLATTEDQRPLSVEIEVLVGKPNLEIEFSKIDSLLGTKLQNVQFEVSVVNGSVVVDNVTQDPHTITTGTGTTKIEIKPDNGGADINEITVIFKEISTDANKNYLVYSQNVEVKYKWDATGLKWVLDSVKYPTNETGSAEESGENNKSKLTLENRQKIEILFNKIDALTGATLPDISFNVTVTEGSIVDEENNPIVGTTTIKAGDKITITPESVDRNVTVTLTEIETPGVTDKYLVYKEPVTITYTWNGSEWVSSDPEMPINENYDYIQDGDKWSWTLTLENREKIELSGLVWIDEPEGEKKIDPPNGIYDSSESPKSGVEVYLYKNDGTMVTEDGYGQMYGTEGYLVTDENGAYKFENVPKLPDGQSYYILFKYDGINYIRTVDGQSKATEKDRATFNNRFKTISAGQSNDGTSLEYDYDGSSISTLITEDGDGKVLDKFEISADTLSTTYNVTTSDIDLGLRKKVLDLSLLTDLRKAIVTINGVQEDIPYSTIFNDMGSILTISQNRTDGPYDYNLNLYRSDYNYRIGDYLGNSTSISHQPNLEPAEVEALQDSRQELEVILEYVIVLNNQSTVDAEVNKFVYDYDSHLVPQGITGGTATNDGDKLTIIPDNPNLGYGGQTTIIVTFAYDVESASIESQPTITNYGEIIEYSTTDGGYVDCDSAPGNAFEGSSFKYEDDSDEANGLKIKATQSEREISGYVFEDNVVTETSANSTDDYRTGDGIYNSGENKVNDVIVQLIEIKNLTIAGTTYRLEYIWQETNSGSNVVKAISADGKSIGTYNVESETGKYTFEGFIPGDYIVRFIYGDGTYYDTAIDANNILKYNGQDYKSTVDSLYNKKYLTTSSYAPSASMARDNEARRLEVMENALSTTDANNLVIDSKAKLENTWMAAETSRIVVNDVIVAPGETEYFSQANFGLIKRPTIALSLKKHITYVSLKGGEGSLNVEATVGMGNYSEDTTEIYDFESSKSSESHPLTAQATTRGNRGYWQVETNKVDGANLKITYSYRATSTGEKDYLHKNLANKFVLTGTDETALSTATQNYITAIRERITAVNTAVKNNSYNIEDSYLGQAYYTGVKGADDTEVGAVIQIEDYLSNDVTLDPSSDLVVVNNSVNKEIINISGNVDNENVRVLKSKNVAKVASGQSADYKISLTKNGLSASDTLEIPSYIAQIVSPITNLAGTRIVGTTPNNLQYVQSYADMTTLDNLGTEVDEYWAETFRIIPTTGGDKQTGPILAISIAAGLSIVVVGIVCIRKFIMK